MNRIKGDVERNGRSQYKENSSFSQFIPSKLDQEEAQRIWQVHRHALWGMENKPSLILAIEAYWSKGTQKKFLEEESKTDLQGS